MAAWSSLEQEDRRERVAEELRCLACGQDLPYPLAWAGSLRCLDCRDAKAPLDPALVREWHEADAQF